MINNKTKRIGSKNKKKKWNRNKCKPEEKQPKRVCGHGNKNEAHQYRKSRPNKKDNCHN